MREEYDREVNNIEDTILSGEDEEIEDAIRKVKEFCNPFSFINTAGCAVNPCEDADIIERKGRDSLYRRDRVSSGGDDSIVDLDNSDVGSFSSGSDDDGSRILSRRQIKFPRYDEKAKEVKFFIGMSFTDSKQCRRALKKYSITERRDYEYVKNEAGRIRAKCKVKNCPWLFFASLEKFENKEYFVIKKYIDMHDCHRVFKVSRANCPWIAKTFESLIAGHPSLKTTFIQEMVREQFHLDVTRNQCKRAKKKVRHMLERDVGHEYAKLHDYGKALVAANPGSHVDIEVDHRGPGCPPFFKRMYVCLAALRKGFLEGCRKFLGLDGCFLKGMVKGQILTAVGKDSNNQMFPLAWAVVEVESASSWEWFLEHLRVDIQSIDGKGWCFMSDQQKVSFFLFINKV